VVNWVYTLEDARAIHKKEGVMEPIEQR